jgi:hypothetical protein
VARPSDDYGRGGETELDVWKAQHARDEKQGEQGPKTRPRISCRSAWGERLPNNEWSNSSICRFILGQGFSDKTLGAATQAPQKLVQECQEQRIEMP